MTLTAWFSLFLVSLLGAMLPGPSLVVVAKNALGGGKINGLFTSWAHASGIAIYALLSVFGLTIILKNNPTIFHIITYIGAFYLLYLGVSILRAKGGFSQKLKEGKKQSYLSSAKEGFLISMLNPKIGLYFLALFSQFIHPDVNTTGKIITVFTPIFTDGGWYTIVTLILSKKAVLDVLRKKAVLIDKITGVLFVLLAVRIFFI